MKWYLHNLILLYTSIIIFYFTNQRIFLLKLRSLLAIYARFISFVRLHYILTFPKIIYLIKFLKNTSKFDLHVRVS